MPTSGYNLSTEIKDLCRTLTTRIEGLSHIDVDRVLFAVTSARKRSRSGIFAACHPLRFEGGSRIKVVNEVEWEWPALRFDGVEILYYIAFYLPRFLNLKRDAKVHTIVHELYHISPHFDGDLRRLGRGRCAYHGPSRAHYERLIAPLVAEAHSLSREPRYDFLRFSFSKLQKRHGGVCGLKVRSLRPRHRSNAMVSSQT